VIDFRSIKEAKYITVRGSRLSCKSDMPRGERRGRSVLTTYSDLTKKGLPASTHGPLGQILISDKEHRVFPLYEVQKYHGPWVIELYQRQCHGEDGVEGPFLLHCGKLTKKGWSAST
jgi:hypothetical protein